MSDTNTTTDQLTAEEIKAQKEAKKKEKKKHKKELSSGSLRKNMMHNNVDLRLKLFAWNNVILPMDVGILGGYDVGRVWYDDQPSDGWHHTHSVGLWLDVLGMAILQPYYSWAEDEDSFSVLARFSF